MTDERPYPPQMNADNAAALRAPFAPEQIGKLPRVTCRDCSSKDTNCTKHQRSKCAVCGGYISSAHIHLDYVGHAATTDRLLQVDPFWSWEPMAFTPEGTPVIHRDGREARMWIRLTVCGVTRYGVGIAETNKFELEKVLIGDALRNAAMRFGVALDLWSKEDLHAEDAEGGAAKPFDSAHPVATGESRAAGHGTPSAPVENIDTMKTRALVEALSARGLVVVGTVKEMRDRLREYEAARAAEEFVGAEASADTTDRATGSSDLPAVGGPGPEQSDTPGSDEPGSSPAPPAAGIPEELAGFSDEAF